MRKPCKQQWVADTHLRQKIVHVCALERWHHGRCTCFCRAQKTPKASVTVCLYWNTAGAGLNTEQFQGPSLLAIDQKRLIELEDL